MFFNTLELIRVKDWLKNILLFVPLVFSGNILNFDFYQNLFINFIIFSLTASIVYIINDIFDIKNDQKHPLKLKIKPLARDSLTINFAIGLISLIIFILLILLFFDSKIIFHIILYLFINSLYILFIKGIIIVDIIIISVGYILRIDAGSLIIGVESSTLMLVSIFSLSFFVLTIKRKKEFENNISSRSSLKKYNITILNYLIYISLFFSIFSYAIYLYLKNSNLFITMPIVILCLLRYLYVSNITNKGEFPIDIFLRDWILFLLVMVYAFIVVINFI
jgi:4-hydroxybenzoate polyprenyltransferase